MELPSLRAQLKSLPIWEREGAARVGTWAGSGCSSCRLKGGKGFGILTFVWRGQLIWVFNFFFTGDDFL